MLTEVNVFKYYLKCMPPIPKPNFNNLQDTRQPPPGYMAPMPSMHSAPPVQHSFRNKEEEIAYNEKVEMFLRATNSAPSYRHQVGSNFFCVLGKMKFIKWIKRHFKSKDQMLS